MSSSLPLSRLCTSWSSSFFLDETLSSSPWIWARTPFGPSSRMIFEIFLESSCEMPSLSPTARRYSLPEALGSPASRTLSDTERLTSLSLNTSSTALARSSLFALISTAWLPDQTIDAPTPRKSKRVPISLAAWFSALSTSWWLIFDTMSKEDSDATRPRLDALSPAGTSARVPALIVSRRPGTPDADLGREFRYPSLCRHIGGARQVARAAKGSGL